MSLPPPRKRRGSNTTGTRPPPQTPKRRKSNIVQRAVAKAEQLVSDFPDIPVYNNTPVHPLRTRTLTPQEKEIENEM